MTVKVLKKKYSISELTEKNLKNLLSQFLKTTQYRYEVKILFYIQHSRREHLL